MNNAVNTTQTEQFIVETAQAFYDDNNNQDLTNEQLRVIAEMTNEKFGTNYTDDDIFDFLEEFEQELLECDGMVCW